MTTNARLRAFVALADHGSVRAAASALVVTESTVSAAVRALVDEVGVALLEQDGRGVRLTPAGARYAGYARRILGLHDEATAAARRRPTRAAATCASARSPPRASTCSPRCSPRSAPASPDVTLGVEVAPSAVVWPMLRHHEVDLVVAGRPPGDLPARVRAVPETRSPSSARPGRPTGFDPAAATWLLREPARASARRCTALLEDLPGATSQLIMGLARRDDRRGAGRARGHARGARGRGAPAARTGALVELPVAGVPISRPWHVVTHPDATASTELLVGHLLADEALGWRRA